MKVSLIKRIGLTAGALALVAAPLFAATVANASTPWGPVRPVLHYNGPGTPGADHVVFNSFDNNPNYGDERTFFDGKDFANKAAGGFQDVIQVNNGQDILLRTYVHNNADSSLNASGAGIARNTKVSIQLPSATATSLNATSIISADNATPGTVFDTVNFQNSNSPFKVSYVAGSAVQYTHAHPAGMKLSDSIVSGGALIGEDTADGNIPGCFQFDSFVDILVHVNGPSLTLTKQVTTPGSTNWVDSLNAKVGDTVAFELRIKNNSTVNVTNATVRDELPAHLKLVPGTVKLVDSNFPNGTVVSDTDLFTKGQDLAEFNPEAVTYIKFRAVVLNDFTATDCTTAIKNQGVVVAAGVSPVYASATVNVARTCTTPPTTPPVTPPVTPPATPHAPLPQTGAEGLAGMTGLGAIGYAVQGYVRSKKSLLDALKK